jgi:cold shock CspA family protein
MQATIKRLNPTFGFATDEEGNDLFFHQSDASDWAILSVGDKVTGDLEQSAKGRRIRNVTKA